MKIFISSDMEGTAGVVDWDQCVIGGSQYPYYTELLTGRSTPPSRARCGRAPRSSW